MHNIAKSFRALGEDLSKENIVDTAVEPFYTALKNQLEVNGWHMRRRTLVDRIRRRCMYEKSDKTMRIALQRANWDHVVAQGNGTDFFQVLYQTLPMLLTPIGLLATAQRVTMSGRYEPKNNVLNIWFEESSNTAPLPFFG